jgi:hypothetical protein
MHVPVIVNRQAIPLDEHIEERHREGQATAQRALGPMTELLERTQHRKHGEDRLDHHAYVPGAAFARFQIRRIPCLA